MIGLVSVATLLMVGAGAAEPAETQPHDAVPAASLPEVFAPPLGDPLDYRVTSRRMGRDGALVEFNLHYKLVWTAAGRGMGLDATLIRITSDAPPALRQVMTGLMEPLVGLPVRYLVSADGSRIDLVDPADVWARAAERAARLGQATPQGEANAMAAVLLAMPLSERNRLLTMHVRALIAAANPAIPRAAQAAMPGVDVSISQQGEHIVVTKSDRRSAVTVADAPGALPLTSTATWAIDDRTGLVVDQTMRNWVKDDADTAPTLVEEVIRTLTMTPAT